MNVANSVGFVTNSPNYLESLRESFHRATKVEINCPLCGGSKMSAIAKLDRHDLGLRIMLCQRCTLAMVNPRPNDAWFNQFYRDQFWPLYIGSRFTDLDDMYVRDQCAARSRQILDAIEQFLNISPRSYLDVGCGQGAMLVEFRSRRPEAVCEGIEPSVDAADYCFTRHGIHVKTGEWNSLNVGDIPGPFDLVTLIHVLEHVSNPVDVLARAVQRLSNKGMIYVEVPDLLSDRWSGKDFFHIAHLSYFHETALRNLFNRCGLNVVAVIRGAAEIWPWAIGFVGRKKPRDSHPPDELPVPPREFGDRVKRHLESRAISTKDSFRLIRNLPWFVCPRKMTRYLLKCLASPNRV